MNRFPEEFGNPNDDARQIMLNNYDASIYSSDQQIGRVLEHLKRLGLDRNTVMVITADLASIIVRFQTRE